MLNVAAATRSSIRHYDLSTLEYLGETMISDQVQPVDPQEYSNNVSSIDCTESELVIGDFVSGNVFFVNPMAKTVSATVELGSGIRSVVAAKGLVFGVSDHGWIKVISPTEPGKSGDLSTRRVLGKLELPKASYGVWDGAETLWISCTLLNRVVKVDIPSMKVMSSYQSFTNPMGLDLDADFVWIANNGESYVPPGQQITNDPGSITRINRKTGASEKFSLGIGNATHFLRRYGKWAFVSGANSAKVYVINTMTMEVSSIPTGPNTIGVEVIPGLGADVARLVATCGNNNTVLVWSIGASS
ncbi:MAG: hypothetical protein HZA66_12620 [Rhodopseudomonas palustris]|uniref:Uncharacterized protein n=1 Tax=Rhodopseudomonas palustris TaxID=1076 RepID=A0A933VUW0_RHOPL|nr:hypothetical protein [Rhodopseudomonas palustris]